ncbi:MAG: cob(I)yrinic acid a,c-diamide adenosyltransferase, partial [Lachnospiraceae bacterium]|nr:cob(I)yrinic acid a,c-diamide adenosyltransferase [Lachnospiraceae bacterium]
IAVLNEIENIKTRHCETVTGWVKDMTEEERAKAKVDYARFLSDLFAEAEAEDADLLILDEILAAVNCGFIEERTLLSFLDEKPVKLEVVLTGRSPSPDICLRADYIIEMKKLKHPYDRGIRARKGIEY